MPSKITTKVLALSLGKGLTTVGTIASAMLMSRILTETQLGTYRQSLLAYDMTTNIFCLGISQGVFYFLPGEKKRSRGVVLDGVLALIAMGFLSGILLFAGRYYLAEQFSNPDLIYTLTYLAYLPIIMLPAGLIASVLVTQNKVQLLTIYNVISNMVLVCSMILACWIWRTPSSVIISKTLVDVCFGAIALLLIFRALPRDEWRPSLQTTWTMIAFSLPLGIASLFGMFQVNLDRILVSSLCPPDRFAIYSNGAIEIPFIGIVTASIATVIQPELRRKIAEGLTSEAVDLFRLSAEKSAVMLIPLMVILFVCAEPLMVFLFSEKYLESATPFRIYLLMLPARVVMYGAMMVALGLNRVVLYRTLGAAIANLAVGYTLVQWIGSPGAAIGTVVSTYLFACGWSIWAIAKAMSVSVSDLLPYGRITGLLGVSLIAGIPSLCLRGSGAIATPWLELALSVVLFLVSLVFVGAITRNDLLIKSWLEAHYYLFPKKRQNVSP